MINEPILDLQISIFALIGVIIFFLVYTKTRELKYYVPAYPLVPLGYFIYYLHHFDPSFRLIGNLIFFMAIILTIVGTFLEYREVFRMSRLKINIYPLLFFSFSTIILTGVQLIIILSLILVCFLQVKIFLKLKTPRHLILMLFQGFAGFGLFNAILNSFDIIGAWELSYISTLLFVAFFMFIPLITYTEKLLLKSRERLKESEQEFQVLFNYATSGVAYHKIVYDQNENPIDYIITNVNPQYEKILSLKRKDVINRKGTEVYLVEPPPYLDEYSRVANTQESLTFETYYAPMNLYFNISVISPKKGVFITVFDNISDRKEVEQKIKESEIRFRSMIEETTDAVFCYEFVEPISIDLPIETQIKLMYDCILVDCNLACARAYGAARIDDVIGRKLTDLFGTTSDSLDKLFTDLVESDYHIIDGLGVEKLPNGEERYFVNNGNGVIEDGKLIRMWGSFRDVTDKILAEEAIKAERDKLQAIMDGLTSASIGIDIVTRDYKVLFQNKVLKDRFGDLTGESCYKKYMGKEEPCEVCPMREAIKNNKVERIELIGSDGRNYELISAPIPNSDGTIETAIEIVMDITKRKTTEQKLKESEEKFRNIAEQSHMGIVILQEDVIKYVNQRMADLFGYSLQEIMNWQPGEYVKIFAPDSLEKVKEQAKKKQSGETGQIDQYIIHCIKKTGELFWVDNISKTIMFQGRPADLITEIDITQKRKAEEKLKESEEKYRTLFEGANDAIFLIKDYKIFECNTKTLEVFGVSNESDIIGLCPWNVSPSTQPDGRDSKQAAIDFMNEALDGKPQRFYWKHLKKDGIVINTEVSLNRIYLENDYFLQAIVRDITEKLKAEEKLKESEEKYRHISENANDMITVLNKEFKHEYINKEAYFNILGYSEEEMLGTNVWEYVHPDDIKRMTKLRNISTSNFTGLEGTDKEELRIKHKKGHYVWLEYTSKIFLDEQGEPKVIAILRDISERKEAERLIIEENIKLQELSDIRQELITRISHELKTPVTSTYGASQALLEIHQRDMSRDVLEFVEIIQRGSKRLKNLVESLLDISRLEARVFKLDLQEENLFEIVRETVNDLKYYANNRDIHINSELPEKLIMNIDKIRISQVFTNIVSNAINNTLPGGSVFISYDINNENIDIIIKDTGVGITETEKSRLFQKFGKIERFGKGTNVYIEGSGLGLYISKEFIKLHEGDIFVESEGRNKGATFTVRLYRKNK